MKMVFNEPKVEFVMVTMNNILTTSNTQGGDTCIGVERDCESVAASEPCAEMYQTIGFDPRCDDESFTGPAFD